MALWPIRTREWETDDQHLSVDVRAKLVDALAAAAAASAVSMSQAEAATTLQRVVAKAAPPSWSVPGILFTAKRILRTGHKRQELGTTGRAQILHPEKRKRLAKAVVAVAVRTDLLHQIVTRAKNKAVACNYMKSI